VEGDRVGLILASQSTVRHLASIVRSVTRFALLSAALLPLAVLQSCVEAAAPGVATTLQIAAGDNQAVVPGDTLVLPLDVFAADAGGHPVGDVTVTWLVTIGNSTVNPVTSLTGADGHATALLRAGSALSEHRVTASARGAAPVEFRVRVQAPCDYLPLYTAGATATGSLKLTDCRLSDGTLIDFWAFDVAATSTLEISMTSSAVDAFLFLFDSAGATIAADDDSGDSLNARLRVLLGPGRYTVGANGLEPGSVGRYQLTSRALPIDVAPCEVRWVIPGVSSSQSLTSDLCSDPATQPVVADHWLFVAGPGRSVTITMNAAFTSRLRLYDDTLALTAEAAAPGPGQPVSLVVSSAEARSFVIQFSSTTGSAGAYTMSLTSP
jgi:hypothetical protein